MGITHTPGREKEPEQRITIYNRIRDQRYTVTVKTWERIKQSPGHENYNLVDDYTDDEVIMFERYRDELRKSKGMRIKLLQRLVNSKALFKKSW